MTAESDDDRGGEAPCFLHLLDASEGGIADEATLRDVARWRRAARERLIAARRALPVAARRAADEALAAALDARLGEVAGRAISLYWPFRGEPDLRGWADEARRRGARIALPVVVRRAAPLVFRDWTGGETLVPGIWNIPVPPEGAETVIPDIVIAPVVGLDGEGYRLGYGGGYYDRTLAALIRAGRRPHVIGVGYESQRITTIYPQHFDIPMDGHLLVPV